MFSRAFNLTAIVVIAYLLVGCGRNLSSQYRSSPQLASAQTGTTDQGGGGNVHSSRHLTIAETAKLIEEAQYYVTPILYRTEAYGMIYEQALKVFTENGETDPQRAARSLISVLDKMFKGELPAIYKVWTQVRINVKLDGPCMDGENQEKDGASFNHRADEICLSAPRIREKVDSHSALAEVLALIVHELSHRVNADENEAKAIQFMIIKQFGDLTLDAMNQAYSDAWLNTPSVWNFSGFEKAFQDKDSQQVPRLCLSIGSNQQQLSRILKKKADDANTLGIMFERPAAYRALDAAVIQSTHLLGFCDGGQVAFPIITAAADNGLDEKKPLPISLLNHPDDRKGLNTLTAEDGKVMFVSPGDWDAALFVYRELSKNMRRYIELVEGAHKTIEQAHPKK